MEIKFSKKELLEIADSGLLDLSCEQIKELIKKESEKDYENINTDFLDLCFDVLAMKQKNISLVKVNSKEKIKKVTIKRVLLFVAIFIMLMITTLTVSAQMFNFNIPKEISSWFEGNAKTDINLKLADTTADGYFLENSELIKELEIQGLSPITLPEELIKENSELIKVDNITTDKSISIDVEIEFNYNDSFGRLVISQYTEDFEWTGEIVDDDVLSAEMIKVNGMDILIFEGENSCAIRYMDKHTTYEIYLETDLKNAKLFAQSIK